MVDTGIQRLVGDLDELPHAALGYQLLEPPGKATSLGLHPLSRRRVRKCSPVSSIVLTIGCKFRCAYCPIPAYNQRQHRVKSGERVVDELGLIASEYGITNFIGTDDNFFNDTKRTLEICEPLARRARDGQRPFTSLRFGTEATVHDTLRIQEHLPTIRRAGLVAVWMGVEDLTGTLVKKGQLARARPSNRSTGAATRTKTKTKTKTKTAMTNVGVSARSGAKAMPVTGIRSRRRRSGSTSAVRSRGAR